MDDISRSDILLTLEGVFDTASEPELEILACQMKTVAESMSPSEIYYALLRAIECVKGVSVVSLDEEVVRAFGDDIDAKLSGLAGWIDQGEDAPDYKTDSLVPSTL